jgi:hypothetical protein
MKSKGDDWTKYNWKRDPYYFGQRFWLLFGQHETRPLRRADLRPWHAPWLFLARLAEAGHWAHSKAFGRPGYKPICFCHWPGCWVIYRMVEIALRGRYLWD